MVTRSEKWTSETRLIWTLFAVIGALLCAIGSMLWGQVSGNTSEIRDLTRFVQRSDVVHQEVIRRLERIEQHLEKR